MYTNTLEKPDLMSQKGVYPYQYMDSFARFNETELPSRESFHSTLSGSGISLEEYERAQHVWQAFECEDLTHYHDIYLQADVYVGLSRASSPYMMSNPYIESIGPKSTVQSPNLESTVSSKFRWTSLPV